MISFKNSLKEDKIQNINWIETTKLYKNKLNKILKKRQLVCSENSLPFLYKETNIVNLVL